MVFITGCTPQSLCSGRWSTSSHSFTVVGVCRGCSSYLLSLLSHSWWSFFPSLLSMLAERFPQLCWWAQVWPAQGPSWSHQEGVLSDMGATSGIFSTPAAQPQVRPCYVNQCKGIPLKCLVFGGNAYLFWKMRPRCLLLLS